MKMTVSTSALLVLLSALALPMVDGAAFVTPSTKAVAPPKLSSRGGGGVGSSSSSSALFTTGGKLKCRLIGVGHAVPKTVVTNFDLEKIMDTSDEWIRTRTGIGKRHLLTHPGEDDSDDVTTSLRAIELEAAESALEMAGVTPEELDFVICGTSTPDDMFGDAATIAAKLGCGKSIMAYDISAACSGFVFSTITAGHFLSASETPKKALVLGADALSRWVDWEDRNTCILFGDGAGAMVMESTTTDEGDDKDYCGILGFSGNSNGGMYCELNCKHLGDPLTIMDGVTVSTGRFGRLYMNGKEVYKFATRDVPVALENAMKEAGVTVDQIDWLLLHQANIRIMEVVAQRLGFPWEKVITNLEDYGNTSGATIPIALDEAVRSGKIKKGDVIATAGFGAGLNWGAAVIKWG